MSKKVKPLYIDSDYHRIFTPATASKLSDENYRSGFRRDYARLIHSPAFRRLQGKTQLFPGIESDFFRNRLTHSLEVAQVAKSIAIKFNSEHEYFQKHPIDTDLVEFAGLSHDLGHPPFGHNGEKALDECMKGCGGFEGNAQTLRIVSKLEKKHKDEESKYGVSDEGEDKRYGLNLCYRSLAAILKYDKKIDKYRDKHSPLVKGYYASEDELVKSIRAAVTGKQDSSEKVKTIECQIMDIADDIAYSTYDLEDALKAEFMNPLDMISAGGELLENIAKNLTDNDNINGKITEQEILEIIWNLFIKLKMFDFESLGIDKSEIDIDNPYSVANLVSSIYRSATNIGKIGYLRTYLTSHLVGYYVRKVEIELNEEVPAISKVFLPEETLKQVEVLKRFTYEAMIMSPRLKVSEYRGYEVVSAIFKALTEDDIGLSLLPNDFRRLIKKFADEDKKRAVCDFIAGMTDRYAVEFYGRLKSENSQTIFKPF